MQQNSLNSLSKDKPEHWYINISYINVSICTCTYSIYQLASVTHIINPAHKRKGHFWIKIVHLVLDCKKDQHQRFNVYGYDHVIFRFPYLH